MHGMVLVVYTMMAGQGMGIPGVVDYGCCMSDETRITDRRYQEPLEPGWWKTASGLKAVLESNRIDRRAKPVVVAFIGAVFFLVNWATGWSDWAPLAVAGSVIIALVLIFSPIDTPRQVVVQEFLPGWWKTMEGWRGPSIGDENPRSRLYFWSYSIALVVVLTAVSGWYGLWVALLAFLPLAPRVAPKQWRPYIVGLLILATVAGFGILTS